MASYFFKSYDSISGAKGHFFLFDYVFMLLPPRCRLADAFFSEGVVLIVFLVRSGRGFRILVPFLGSELSLETALF
jgi:hypothetical protein